MATSNVPQIYNLDNLAPYPAPQFSIEYYIYSLCIIECTLIYKEKNEPTADETNKLLPTF